MPLGGEYVWVSVSILIAAHDGCSAQCCLSWMHSHVGTYPRSLLTVYATTAVLLPVHSDIARGLDQESAVQRQTKPLFGVGISIKDCINVKGCMWVYTQA